MATAYTSLLGLALPVTGELSGSWGDTVNDSITSLLDSAISGTTTLSADADVTLTTSDGVANEARQAILLWTAGGTVTRNITAPAQSKAYFVVNKTSSTQSIVIRGAGPTTGVTVRAGQQSLVVWNGVDFVEVASGDVDGPSSATDNAVARFDGTTGKLIQNSVVTIADSTGNMAGVGTLGVGAITTSGALTYGGVTLNNAVTGTGNMVLSTSPTLVTPILGTPTSATLTNATGLPISTGVSGLGTGVATFLGTPSSANLAAAVTDETGTGALVFATSPTLVTPALGTPSSATLTNATGLPISTGVSGLGTGVATALAVNVGSAGAPVVNGGALGTPSSGTLTNATGLPVATGISGLGSGVATFLATPSSANLAAAVTDETGTGALVFANSPTLVTPALGTPASGVVTNLTGTASININGTVGATTPSTGNFTVLNENGSPVVVQTDIGTAPNEIPLNQYLGNLAYQDAANIAGPVGVGGALSAAGGYNGTVGATTASTGAFTTLSATGVTTVQAGTAAAPAITTSGDTNTGIFFPAADTIAFAEGGAEAMRIDSGGNLLVGTTSTSNTDIGFKASVNGTTIVHTSASTFGQPLLLNRESSDGNLIVFRRANSTVGSISVTDSLTSYNVTSDYRLKNTIAPMTGALAKVALLKPCTYKWNADGSDCEGFIAHELAEVCPLAVTGDKDAVDAEGKPQYQGIDTSFLVATLTAALQELNAKFDAYVATHP